MLDVRATLESHDNALIYIRCSGVGDFVEDGYQQFLEGTQTSLLLRRTAPMMQTAHPDYQWVNRLQFVNVGEVNFAASVVAYDRYALKWQ